MNGKRYFVIKYILSIVFFILIIIRTKNLIFALVYFFIIFLIPDFLILKFQKDESIKLIKEIRNLSSNLSLMLTSNLSLYEAFKTSLNLAEYKRFKDNLEIFINDYSLYNFNIKPALEKFKSNFTSEEFEMFINIVYQGEKEGKVVEMLDVFGDTLELSYFKYVKKRERMVSFYILIASMLSLFSIIIITIYPMIIQILENINIIFK